MLTGTYKLAPAFIGELQEVVKRLTAVQMRAPATPGAITLDLTGCRLPGVPPLTFKPHDRLVFRKAVQSLREQSATLLRSEFLVSLSIPRIL
jgi:hypothetical protein